MNGYEKEVKKILQQHGWAFSRQAKESHEYWGKTGHGHITVPHGYKLTPIKK